MGIISNIFTYDFIKLIPKRFFHFNYPIENFYMATYLSSLFVFYTNFSKAYLDNTLKLSLIMPIPLILVFLFLLQSGNDFTFHIKPLMRYNYPLFVLLLYLIPFLLIYIFNLKYKKNMITFFVLLISLYSLSFVNATDNKILEIRNNASYLHSDYYINHLPFSTQNESFKNLNDCIEKNCLIFRYAQRS